jgi:hypothetical protein
MKSVFILLTRVCPEVKCFRAVPVFDNKFASVLALYGGPFQRYGSSARVRNLLLAVVVQELTIG